MTTMMLMIIITNRKKGKDDFKATLGCYLGFMAIKMAGTRATDHIIPRMNAYMLPKLSPGALLLVLYSPETPT